MRQLLLALQPTAELRQQRLLLSVLGRRHITATFTMATFTTALWLHLPLTMVNVKPLTMVSVTMVSVATMATFTTYHGYTYHGYNPSPSPNPNPCPHPDQVLGAVPALWTDYVRAKGVGSLLEPRPTRGWLCSVAFACRLLRTAPPDAVAPRFYAEGGSGAEIETEPTLLPVALDLL